MKKTTKTILVLGTSRSAVSGVSTHINQLLESSLAEEFSLEHFQVGSTEQERSYQVLFRLMLSPFFFLFVLLTRQPAIVHLNTSTNVKAFWRDVAYLMVAKLLRRAVIYQVHGGEAPEEFCRGRWYLVKLVKWILTLPDVVVVLWEGRAADFRDFADTQRLCVIPNAIDLSEFHGFPAKKFDGHELNLVYIGRLTHRKGIHEGVEAVAILTQQMGFAGAHLTIAGSGPEQKILEDRARALGISNHISFIGPIFGAEKKRFWENAELFVFPTFTDEGLPYALLESLASGTPVITTRTAAIPDVLREGLEGLFVEPRDAQGVAKAVFALSSDRPLLRRLSEACMRRAKENYGIERLAQQFSELYEEVWSTWRAKRIGSYRARPETK